MKKSVIFSLCGAIIVAVIYGLLHELTAWMPNGYRILWQIEYYSDNKFINLPEMSLFAQMTIIFFSVFFSIRLVRLIGINVDQKLINECLSFSPLLIMFMLGPILGICMRDDSGYWDIAVVGLSSTLITALVPSVMMFLADGNTNEGHFVYYRLAFFQYLSISLIPFLLIPPFFLKLNLAFFFILICFILTQIYLVFKLIERLHKRFNF